MGVMEEVGTMPSNTQEFCLRWNNFHSSLVSALDGFKNDLDFVDVTLACEGQFLKAHKMLLSACSVFFRDLLKANPCQHPIVILPPEVRFIDLEKMLRFIYQGEVNVQQENLARFLKTAEMLKIRGLAEDSEKQKVLQASSPRPPEGAVNSSERNDNSSVSPKRPRLSIETQSGSINDPPQTPNDENSRLSGPDSDSEMIPVKQEMIELKECDFETGDSDSFLAETYLRECSAPSATSSSNNTSNLQTPQTHPNAPPPPGPLLPSYVPPPQVKAQDDSPQTTNQDDLAQGTVARLAADPLGTHGGRGEEDGSAWTPGQTPRSSNPRFILSRSLGSNKYQKKGSPASTTSSPASPRTPSQSGTPSPVVPPKAGVKRSPAQRVSPGKGGTPKGYSPGGGPGSKGCSPTGSSSKNFSPSGGGKGYSSTDGGPKAYSPTGARAKGISPSGGASSGFYPSGSGSNGYSPGASAVTGSSRSIWHPPSSTPTFGGNDDIGEARTITPTPMMVVSPLTCDICAKTFTSRSNLNKHKRVQHSGEEYLCPFCKRTFKNRYYIKDHVSLCAGPHKKNTQGPDAPTQQHLGGKSSPTNGGGNLNDKPKRMEN